DDNWESKVHQFKRTFSRSPSDVRFEKLRPAATHPNLRKAARPIGGWLDFDIWMNLIPKGDHGTFSTSDEIEITKLSGKTRLPDDILTQDVANLSQEVRTTLALLQQKYECTVTLPQTSQSLETRPTLKRSSTNNNQQPRPSSIPRPKQTSTCWTIFCTKDQNGVLHFREIQGAVRVSPSEEKVTFLVGHSSTGEDNNYLLDFATPRALGQEKQALAKLQGWPLSVAHPMHLCLHHDLEIR
ncbi:uncharacterized protein CEXT_23171, partial [Caerostris extrusa]